MHNRTERHGAAVGGGAQVAVHRPELADLLDRPDRTVSAILKRQGMGKLGGSAWSPRVRYERARPGELIHIDVRRLGPIDGRRCKRIKASMAARPSHRTDAEADAATLRGWEAVTCRDR